MAKAYVVLQMLDIGSWATPVYPACDDEFCLATVRRSTDIYRGILFPMQHLQFWDLSSPPLVNPCDGIMEMKWTVRALSASSTHSRRRPAMRFEPCYFNETDDDALLRLHLATLSPFHPVP
eukprot:scaffold52888_cov70-Phaeocystis_antarctica.AAC.17